MIEKTLKAITKTLILCSVVMFAGCSDNEIPGKGAHYDPPTPQCHTVFFTQDLIDCEETDTPIPEVITIDASEQTVVLSVKRTTLPYLKMSKYYVGEWDEQRQQWRYVKDSALGPFPPGEFYSTSASEENGEPIIRVKFKANDTQEERRMLIHAVFVNDEYIPYGIVEIVQAPAS